MEREIEIKAKGNDSYKLILKLELNEDSEELLKKKLNLLALCPINNKLNEIIETLFGYYWYKDCEINIIK